MKIEIYLVPDVHGRLKEPLVIVKEEECKPAPQPGEFSSCKPNKNPPIWRCPGCGRGLSE